MEVISGHESLFANRIKSWRSNAECGRNILPLDCTSCSLRRTSKHFIPCSYVFFQFPYIDKLRSFCSFYCAFLINQKCLLRKCEKRSFFNVGVFKMSVDDYPFYREYCIIYLLDQSSSILVLFRICNAIFGRTSVRFYLFHR